MKVYTEQAEIRLGALTSFRGEQGPRGEKGETGAPGPMGPQGVPGKDGVSPIVTVEQTETGARLTVTDAGGTTGAEISNGLNAPQIDDGAAREDRPWSGAKVAEEIGAAGLAVIERVCPTFEQSGGVVQCYPVEGSSLDVVTRIEAVREGAPDPGQENAAPVTGRDSLSIVHAGELLLDYGKYFYDNDRAVLVRTRNLKTGVPYTIRSSRPLKMIKISYGNYGIGYVFKHSDTPFYTYSFTVSGISDRDLQSYGLCVQFYDASIYVKDINDLIMAGVQIVPGRYDGLDDVPYAACTQALPETVYGGSYNWTTGKLTVESQLVDGVIQKTEPYAIELAPRQILAYSGVNTFVSDAGDTTVSGRADPVHLTQTMLDRLAALEAAQTGL